MPRVLYHWREIPTSAAMSIEEKPNAPISGRKAVKQAMKRRNLKGYVTSNKLCPTLYQIKLQPRGFPKVSIIIPTRNSFSLLQKCICSIRQHTSYPNYEILIIDNQSDDLRVKEYLAAESSRNHLKVMQYNNPFNHSELNNIAVSLVNTEFVVFMNNDIQIVSHSWLEQLVAVAHIDDSIAAVGGLLLYPDGRVQHGGMILGILGLAGHAHKHMNSKSNGYFGRLYAIQEMSGITAALALVRRSSLEDVGGFDSNRYPTTFNDVDLCIRLRKRGFRCLYNPMVRAIHHESKTRLITQEDIYYKKRLVDDYSEILRNDPFYNPNLALDNEQFHGFRPFPVEEQIPELKVFETQQPAKK
jgi:GT2 family glycosyltransferase